MNFQKRGQKLITKKQTKYLGINMDEHISFIPHIKSVKH